MRTQQKIFTLLAIVTWITTSSSMFGQRAIADGPDPDAGSVLIKTLSSSSETTTLQASVAGSNCASTGGIGQSFINFNANPYRGIVFQVDDTTTLNEIFIELEFGLVGQPLSAQASFSIHRASIGSNVYTPVFVQDPPITLLGTGQKLYGSGQLLAPAGVVLTGGFNYAIGITWDSTEIRYFRDTAITNLYPQDFPGNVLIPDGTILGLIGKEFQNLPLKDDPFSIASPFNRSAYSMQLCIAPKLGACCDAARPFGCEEVFADQCDAPGSFFQGQKTVCEPGRCQFGACCTGCKDPMNALQAECKDDYVREQCEAELGDWQGSGVSCAAGLCPIVTGACCVPDALGTGVSTVELCETDCLAAGGVYNGDGSPLVPSPCEGACCLAISGCSTLSPGDCAGFSGVYRGGGTECNNLEPALECGGACCFGTGNLNSCNNLATRAECVDAGNVTTAYGGDSSTCGGTSCSSLTDLGACCLPDGTCVNATGATCESASMLGVFNATCNDDGVTGCFDDTDCVDDVGTCGGGICTGDGATTCVIKFDCILAGGDCIGTCSGGSRNGNLCDGDHEGPTGCPDITSTCVGMSCDAVSCGTEECCFDDGHCEDITAFACTQRGLLSGGIGSSCSDTSCAVQRGGCCQNDGTCSVLDELACDAAGGRYLGDNSVCTMTDTCPITVGSCCRPNHSCKELVTQAECTLLGGMFNADPNCANAACPGTGGCCTEMATCLTLSESECLAITGNYSGDNTVCGVDAICPTGACCSQDGVCSNVNQFVCDQNAGSYLGDTLVCNVDAFCVTGACCMPDTTCADLTVLGCDIAGGIFHGDGTGCPDDTGTCQVNVCVGGDNDGVTCSTDNDCRTRLCSFGSCCETTGNCVDGIINFQCDLTVTPTATFTLDAVCGDCPQGGACCFGDESCVQMIETECLAANGFFQGELTSCPASGQGGFCTLGACCELDGNCTDGLPRSACDAFALSNHSPGQLCSQNSCVPRGACCESAGNCVDNVEEVNCTGTNNYAGDGSICQADTCELGACCLLSLCEGGLDDGNQCDTANSNNDCRDISAPCSSAVCHGGPRRGLACIVDFDCPLSNCFREKQCLGGMNDAAFCSSSADCPIDQGICTNGNSLPACIGGLDDGSNCDINNGNSDCRDNVGSCEIEETVCEAGVNMGSLCATAGDCPSSVCIDARYCDDRSVSRKLCSIDNDCILSVCGPQNVCLGGSNKGSMCTTDNDCPFANSKCLQPGICRNGANNNEACTSNSDCMVDIGICDSPDHCGIVTDVLCLNLNGLPQGAGSTCSPGGCEIGACCNSAGVCLDGVPISACDDPLDFRVHETCASQTCVARGACCHAGGCDEVSLNECIGQGGLGGTYEGDTTTCDPADLCSVGACCMFDGTCAQSTRQACEDGGGIYAGSGLPCDGSVDCNVGSCCLGDGSCLVDAVVNVCNAMNGSFTIGGDCSNLATCLQIVSSVPSSGVSDARIPHERNDVNAIFGTDRVVLTFNADATSLTIASFAIVEVGGDANASVPTIVSVNHNVGGNPNVVELSLSRIIDVGTWTTITHVDSGSQICLGVQPADVDSNGMVEPSDFLAHVNNLGMINASPLSTDIDRSGSQNALDLIELINLQTGAGSFLEWRIAPTIGASPCN